VSKGHWVFTLVYYLMFSSCSNSFSCSNILLAFNSLIEGLGHRLAITCQHMACDIMACDIMACSLCMARGIMYGTWHYVWHLTCMACGIMYGTWHYVWHVALCMACGIMYGMWHYVRLMTLCLHDMYSMWYVWHMTCVVREIRTIAANHNCMPFLSKYNWH